MPKLIIPGLRLPETVKVGIWEMSESEEELYAENPALLQFQEQVSGIKSPVRRLEYLSVRHIMFNVLGEIQEVYHNSDGKPYLQEGPNISISHTKGYAAVVLSENLNVALDMEYRSERVCRIAPRFLREDETPTSTEGKLLCWCAKETLYKLHSSDKLTFHEMRISSLPEKDGLQSGKIIAQNLRRNVAVEVSFVTTRDFVLTYAFENGEKM